MLLRKRVSGAVAQQVAHFTAASRSISKGLGGVMQGVINKPPNELLQLLSSAQTASLESARVPVLREKAILEQSFLVQPLHDLDREVAE